MIDKETEDKLNELQNKIIRDLAESDAEDSGVMPGGGVQDAYIEGYIKGYTTCMISAEKYWKQKAKRYDELVKSGEIEDTLIKETEEQ